MSLHIITKDITKMNVEAIVNPANTSLLGGGGADGSIHKAAGPKLLEKTKTMGGCKVGQAKITLGYDLKAKYIIHTVGSIWHGGNNGEEKLLEEAYENSLKLAREYSIKTIAFPLISAGAYGYPKDKVVEVALKVFNQYLKGNDIEIYLVVYNKEDLKLFNQLNIKEYHN